MPHVAQRQIRDQRVGGAGVPCSAGAGEVDSEAADIAVNLPWTAVIVASISFEVDSSLIIVNLPELLKPAGSDYEGGLLEIAIPVQPFHGWNRMRIVLPIFQ